MSFCDLYTPPPRLTWVHQSRLVVLLGVVVVWIISELLNVAKFHVWTQVTKYKAIFNGRCCGYPESLWKCRSSQFLLSASSNKDPRNSPYYFSEVGGGLRSWKGCLIYSLILFPSSYWQGFRMVYRLSPPFKACLLMFWDIYPISGNSRDRISTLNYILSIFGMEWAVLMEKTHQSGKGLRKALICLFVEIIYIDVKFLRFYEFNNNLAWMWLTPSHCTTPPHVFFLFFNFFNLWWNSNLLYHNFNNVPSV